MALKEAMERASHFEEEIESVLSWLPKLEETLNNMGPVAADIRSIKIQIEEVKILKLQAVGKADDVCALCGSMLCLSSTKPSKQLQLNSYGHRTDYFRDISGCSVTMWFVCISR